jgi:hypothetical protein
MSQLAYKKVIVDPRFNNVKREAAEYIFRLSKKCGYTLYMAGELTGLLPDRGILAHKI